jgi:hypothetical protein
VEQRLGMIVMEPGSLIMERKMLLGIKQRAERLVADQQTQGDQARSLLAACAIAVALAGRRVGAHVQARRLGQLFALLLIAVAVFLVAKSASAAV